MYHRTLLPIQLAVLLGALSGCSSSLFGPAGSRFDPQACVEDAIRGDATPAVAPVAAAEFERACRNGDASACSALGVITEVGWDRPADPGAAAGLFARACQGGNARGCVHLSRLELDGQVPGAHPVAARSRLEGACLGGEPFACEELGKRLATGDGLPRDVHRARPLLEVSCQHRRGDACFELASIDAPVGTIPDPWTLELFVTACVAGHEGACARLDSVRPVPGAARGSAVAGM